MMMMVVVVVMMNMKIMTEQINKNIKKYYGNSRDV